MSKRCPFGFMFHAQSCYKFVSNSLDWNRAKAECTKEGASLVKITSMKENTFLNDQMPGDSWIGLARENGGNFSWWTDRDYALFTNWYGQKPSSDVEKGCTVLLKGSGRWKATACEAKLSYICEHFVLD